MTDYLDDKYEDLPLNPYDFGYLDGVAGVEHASHREFSADYLAGYADGTGEHKLEKHLKKSTSIHAEYSLHNDPPDGYDWAFEFRTPYAGELYLTKNGNAGIAKEAKNGRKRHILRNAGTGSTYDTF